LQEKAQTGYRQDWQAAERQNLMALSKLGRELQMISVSASAGKPLHEPCMPVEIADARWNG